MLWAQITFLIIFLKSIHFKNSVLLFCKIFDWLIFHYFFQLMPAEVSLTISWKSNEKLVNKKLSKTVIHCFYNECSLVRTLCKTFFDKISFSSTWTELRYVAFFSKIMFMTTTFSVVVFCCYCRNMTTQCGDIFSAVELVLIFIYLLFDELSF